ncbi:hypothetical protein [Altibacter sp. HG106]|uniref:hypothetical protein n=1 Tax=Altibacter sp. HG106 TaxID=3023937 RepID=UPI002350DD04|nr:hypothetical protein [Altibacter sp. HG106]MDC7994833.1 hypothetical protein [Altibacter sp. HG106]
MKIALLITAFIFFGVHEIFGQKSIEAIDKLAIQEKISISKNNDSVPGLQPFLKGLRAQEVSETKINGKLGFGLTLKNSQNQDLSEFRVSAEASRGFFPGEFEFESSLNVQVRDGVFIENLSTLAMSYDHHIGNELQYEFYSFIRRSSNNFLNIDQRYEVGVGLVWNAYLSGSSLVTKEDNINKENTSPENKEKLISSERKKRLTPAGATKFNQLRSFECNNERIGKNPSEAFLSCCSENVCFKGGQGLLTKKEIVAFRNSMRRSVLSVIKEESKIRFSMLAGINYESERTSDSLQLRYTDTIFEKRSFDPVNLVRAVIGSGLELKIDKFSLKSKCYFKVGVSDGALENEVSEGPFSNKRVDYRLEWITSSSLKISENISLKGTLLYTHINAPRRAYFTVVGVDDLQLYQAANRFLNFQLGFEYKL